MKFYRNILKSILFPVLFLAIDVHAQEYGMVMDVVGEVTLHRDNNSSYIIEAGDSIMDGDRLSVPDKSELILVSYLISLSGRWEINSDKINILSKLKGKVEIDLRGNINV